MQQFANSGTAFPKNYSMTLGSEVATRTVNIPDSSDAVELVVLDCSGREIYSDILAAVWQGAALVLAVFDLTREESLAAARVWAERAREAGGGRQLPGVLLGNKSDLADRRLVGSKAGLDSAAQLGFQYFEASAKENTGLEEPFYYLANEFHKLYSDQATMMASLG